MVLVPGYEMPGGIATVESGNSTTGNANETSIPTGTTSGLILTPEATMNTTNDQGSSIKGPPRPSAGLVSVCSQDSLSTPDGQVQCTTACEIASSCCNVQEEEESSCYDAHKEVCDMYSPCTNLASVPATPPSPGSAITIAFPAPSPNEEEGVVPSGGGEQQGPATQEETSAVEGPGPGDPAENVPQQLINTAKLPKRADTKLTMVCAYETLACGSTGGSTCINMCQEGACCSDYASCLDEDYDMYSQEILTKLDNRCQTYRPCNNLFLMQDPPENLGEICDGNNEEECAGRCSTVSCCFSESDSCNDSFPETCLAYAPYCDKAPTITTTTTTTAATEQPKPTTTNAPRSPPPSKAPADLAAFCAFSVDFCSTACQGALCCFKEPSSNSSCADGNEEICLGYSPCATIFDQES